MVRVKLPRLSRRSRPSFLSLLGLLTTLLWTTAFSTSARKSQRRRSLGLCRSVDLVEKILDPRSRHVLTTRPFWLHRRPKRALPHYRFRGHSFAYYYHSSFRPAVHNPHEGRKYARITSRLGMDQLLLPASTLIPIFDDRLHWPLER